MGCHAHLQGIFPTQGLNLGLPYCSQILYHLSHQGSPSGKIMPQLKLHSGGKTKWRQSACQTTPSSTPHPPSQQKPRGLLYFCSSTDFPSPIPVSWMVQAGIRTETQIHGASLSKNTPGLQRSPLQWSCSRSRPPEWLRIQQHSSHPRWTTQ